MIQRFAPLFEIDVRHSYYAVRCEDFDYFVPSSTAAAMRGGQVLARVREGRLHVLYEAGSPGVPLNSLTGRTLVFGLRLTNASFSNFTNPVVSDVRQTPFYSNSKLPAVLEPPEAVCVTSGVHTHTPRTESRPLTLRLSDHAGIPIAVQELPVGAVDGQFDMRALPEGDYRIDEDLGAGSVARSQLVLSTELRGAGVWGLLAIAIDNSFYAAPPTFTLEFTARQEQLKYFVVAKNFKPAAFDLLTVTDNGFNDDKRPQLVFDKVLPNAFSETDISPSLLDDSDGRIVLFRSTVAVARREQGYRRIQLSRNDTGNGDGDVLVAHLPLPAADKLQAHFIIHVTQPQL